MSRLTIGGVLAVVLLGLFAYAVVVALQVASNCASQNTCVLSDSIAFLLQTIGALVSAVVISELAVTPPKDAPGTLRAAGYSDKSEASREDFNNSLHSRVAHLGSIYSRPRLGPEYHSSSVS